MSKGETAAEPSMDEILSSIRKIIAEDEVEDAASEPEGGHGGTTDAAASAAEEDEDDILELTEEDEISAADEPAAAPVETFDDTAVPVAAPSAQTPRERPVAEMPDHDQVEPDTPPLDPDTDCDAAAMLDGAGAPMQAVSEVLLDSGVATAANGALHRLSAAMAPGAAIPAGERTLEAFLADLVRPELKAWLDQHLPGLVERIVEREIKRLVRDAQPE